VSLSGWLETLWLLGSGRNIVYLLREGYDFARDDAHFRSMLQGAWRTLKPGGLFLSRLASTIGGEHQLQHISGRWYQMADGTERYLVDEPLLMQWTAELGAQLVDPIKTTVVQNLRSMTTWILRKPG